MESERERENETEKVCDRYYDSAKREIKSF